MSTESLPDLELLTTMDERLRQVPLDEAAFRAAFQQWKGECDAARDGTDPGRLRRALAMTGSAHRILGEYPEAERDLLEARALTGESGDWKQEVAGEIRLAELDRCRDAYAASEERLRRALATIEASGEDAYLDFALQHLGKTLTDAGRAIEAIPLLTRALELRESRGIDALIASTRQALARATSLAGPGPV